MFPLIDTHAHYDNARFDDDRETLLGSLKENNIISVINSGFDYASSLASIALTETFESFYTSVGVHPHDASTLQTQVDLDAFIPLCKQPKVVAFGEIGLDYYYDHSPRDHQRKWFEKQLIFAHEQNLPVVIHIRDAHEDGLQIIKNSPVRCGTLHCFSGDANLAMEYIELGFHIGIGGVVTFDKTGTNQDVVKQIPIERIVLETDCPYLTPKPFRGKRNDSTMLKYVAEKIAEIKNIGIEDVCSHTTKNAKKLYKI